MRLFMSKWQIENQSGGDRNPNAIGYSQPSPAEEGVLYTPTWTAHLRGLCALLIDTAVEVLLLIWPLLTAMYSVVQFVCDDSVAVAAKSWFVGDQLVAWPRDREMQRLLEANRRPTDGAKLYEVKVLKDGLDLGKARRLARKAEDTDNLSSSEPAALGRGMRTKYPRILTSDSEDENDIDDLQGNTRGRLGPWPVPPAALRQPNENLPPERQLLQEIKQELMSLRKKVDFLSEKAILSDSNFKDMKAMLADTRRALQTVSFVSKEKPPVIQLPLRTSEDYDEFVSKVGTDREIFEETMQYVTTVSIAAAIRKLSGKQRLNGSTEPEIDTEGEQNAAGLLTCDVSDVPIGTVLSQQQSDGHGNSPAFVCQMLNKPECNHSTIRKELLAVVALVKKLNSYLAGKWFIEHTDHKALRWLENFKDPTAHLARWHAVLLEYPNVVVHRAGKKCQNADALPRRAQRIWPSDSHYD
ncbi:hypothetical protein SprV_0802645400 [Sparganum proliferum]